MARKPPSDNSIRGDSIRVHCPGAYQHVLDKVCTQLADSVGDWLTASADPISMLEYELRQAERKAALKAERNGSPIKVQSHMLPRGLHAPFNRPGGGHRGMFVVTPEDEISFLPAKFKKTA